MRKKTIIPAIAGFILALILSFCMRTITAGEHTTEPVYGPPTTETIIITTESTEKN